jgi:putative tryptophan/tyrosine transport system substrate-binding protein
MQFGHLKRRELLTLLGGAAVLWPAAVQAQQDRRVRWIGALTIYTDSEKPGLESTTAFEEGLAALGWNVGRNVAIDYRWAVTDVEKGRSAVAQVLRLSPDLILVNGGPALTAAQQATRTVPIVFTGVSEPVERGFITSLARPGGNTTGFANMESTVGGKWLELFKEIVPGAVRVRAVFDPASSFAKTFFRSAETAGDKLSIQVSAAHVHDLPEIEAAVSAIGREPGTGLILPPDGFTPAYGRQILSLIERYRIPTITAIRSFVVDGALASYGPNLLDPFRHAATYVDRILKGEKPAELPVQNPTKYDLVINLKTAKALGLEVPPMLLARADEVIE